MTHVRAVIFHFDLLYYQQLVQILILSVLLSRNSSFISFTAPDFYKVFVQQPDKLDWGTEFIGAGYFSCSPGPCECMDSRGMWHRQGRALLGEGKDRTVPFHGRFSWIRCFLCLLVMLITVSIPMDIYVKSQMHLPSKDKNLSVPCATWSAHYPRKS